MKRKMLVILTILAFMASFTIASVSNKSKATDINQKICWGIKRNDNHEQPDLGKENTELIKKT